MSSVQVANSLQMGSVDTPLDARTRIPALTNVPDIALPYVGMVFFCSATGRHYKVKTLKSKQIGAAVQPDAAVDAYEPVPDQSDLAGKAAKDHSHTGYENRLSTLETALAAIFHLGIVRPNYDDALHLQIQENGETVVDTAGTEGRAKVKVFTGQEWAEFPSGGAGAPFSEMSVDIDLTSLGGGSHYLRYKWYNASTSTDWVGVTFPSSGGGGGAGGGSGENFSVYIDPSTGNWIINGEDSGVCAVGKLQVVTSIPDNPVEGMILIS